MSPSCYERPVLQGHERFMAEQSLFDQHMLGIVRIQQAGVAASASDGGADQKRPGAQHITITPEVHRGKDEEARHASQRIAVTNRVLGSSVGIRCLPDRDSLCCSTVGALPQSLSAMQPSYRSATSLLSRR